MAGIYVHIPFCRQKCYYCDFYKTVNTSLTQKFIEALKKELTIRQNYLEGETVETIYFGGGTPSVLNELEINEILYSVKQNFSVSMDVEITLEANPDDLSVNYLQEIYKTGIRRLSIGIQSFDDDLLKLMNRRHNARQAVEAVENAAKTGFSDISIDLIYGLPGLKRREWTESLNRVFQLPVVHLSAYHLTYHKGTPFYTWLKKGTLKALNESESVWQFNILNEMTGKNGFEQYEISNFAKHEKYSKHNAAYWNGVKYIGLGASAHSFNGTSRSWNISHIEGYIRAVMNNLSYSEVEILSENEKYNEYVLTHIRTKWGVSTNELTGYFGEPKTVYFQQNIEKYINRGLVKHQNGIYTLTPGGWLVSDEIMSNLMYI